MDNNCHSGQDVGYTSNLDDKLCLNQCQREINCILKRDHGMEIVV